VHDGEITVGSRSRSSNTWRRRCPPAAARESASASRRPRFLRRDARWVCRVAHAHADEHSRLEARPHAGGGEDIRRIAALREDRRARFGDGPSLFGRFSNADAMYASVVPASTPTAWTCTALRALRRRHPRPAADAGMIRSGQGQALVNLRERRGVDPSADALVTTS
jgi:hypothetical protein